MNDRYTLSRLITLSEAGYALDIAESEDDLRGLFPAVLRGGRDHSDIATWEDPLAEAMIVAGGRDRERFAPLEAAATREISWLDLAHR